TLALTKLQSTQLEEVSRERECWRSCLGRGKRQIQDGGCVFCSSGGKVEERVAFSVARMTNDYPARSSLIKFTKIITNINDVYNTQTGRFRCTIPGTYYFVYHASLDASLCVKMKLDDTLLASFCDHRRKRKQVTSGGLAVYVSKDQEVFLETSDYRSMRANPSGYSIFSGFLLQAH
ncbi:complement C1q subcomponent subunit C-like, partial [Boleophthalmus pectinirostris]|uniref:complement C1q subcomponent subunit C-like n=1 Tax=Boleophthalmus pectinirostris TaxID=150288 RepID=UPI00242AB02D